MEFMILLFYVWKSTLLFLYINISASISLSFTQFKTVKNNSIVQSVTVTALQKVHSEIACASLCGKQEYCCSGTYESDSKLCRLYKKCGHLTYVKNGSTLLLRTYPELKCPVGWKSYDLHCYFFNCQQVFWFDAKTGCESSNSHLVAIETTEENDWIYYNNPCTATPRILWTDLSDAATEGRWIYSHDNRESSYLPWSTNEPSNDLGKEHCAAIFSRVLYDQYCDFEHDHAYVCETLQY